MATCDAIERVVHSGVQQKVSITDYGCFEGGYSLAFARQGYSVLGVEGREENLKRCHFLKTVFDLPNLDFQKSDVSEMNPLPESDVSFVSGLLYHLENPCSFLTRLAKATNHLLILNTHYSTSKIPSRFRNRLGRMSTHEGYRGRWYTESEHNGETEFPRSSLGNNKSFWLTKESLLQVLRYVGFTLLLEQFDTHYSMQRAATAIRRNARSQFLAVK